MRFTQMQKTLPEGKFWGDTKKIGIPVKTHILASS